MSSQRHRQIVRNYGAACTPIAEKQPAAGYLRQLPGPFTVPMGPAGGPLQGSSLAGPVPVAIPAPGIMEELLLLLGVALGGSQRPPVQAIEGPPTGEAQPAAQGEQPAVAVTEPAISEPARELPPGTIEIESIDDHADGLSLRLPKGSGIKAGDTVRIEASGNSSVNGTYEVLSAKRNVVVVETDYTLDQPIEGKGRVTLVSEA